jgi:hypothetical protein
VSVPLPVMSWQWQCARQGHCRWVATTVFLLSPFYFVQLWRRCALHGSEQVEPEPAGREAGIWGSLGRCVPPGDSPPGGRQGLQGPLDSRGDLGPPMWQPFTSPGDARAPNFHPGEERVLGFRKKNRGKRILWKRFLRSFFPPFTRKKNPPRLGVNGGT